jgi:hypothetical protein
MGRAKLMESQAGRRARASVRLAHAVSLLLLGATNACSDHDNRDREPTDKEALAVTAMAAQPLPRLFDWWFYTEFHDAYCRDGSRTGVAVNAHPGSTKLMIYLEQGGACFNEATCAINPSSAIADTLLLGLFTGAAGVFDRSHLDNPVRDWNFVYVPYCTGDLHMGSKPDGLVPNVGPQRFVGFQNMKLFVPRIAATFPGATDVLLTGASAGGAGSFGLLEAVQAAFPQVRVKAINDAGPMLSSAVFGTCAQDRIRDLWGLTDTWLALCGAACPNKDDFLQDFGVHLGEKFPDRPLGFLVGARDVSLRAYGSMTKNDCTAPLDVLNPSVGADEITADFLRFRGKVAPFPNFNTFYGDSDLHTFTAQAGFYTLATKGGTKLVDWFTAIVKGGNPGHAGP